MNISQVVIYVMVLFMLLAAGDKIIGNRFGLGEKFDEGIMAMGTLAISMIGIVALAPVLANILEPVVVPLYTALGADPAMFATTLLACDMGGYPLAQELALTPEAADFAGIILGSMLGPTIVFTIPVALGIIKKEDHPALAKGVLAGIITIPIGCFVGGLVAGYELEMILHNLVPIVIVSIIIAIGLFLIPEGMIKGFTVFGKAVVVIATFGFAVAIAQQLTGLVIIEGMAPVTDGIAIVGSIAIVLAGAYPLVYVITKIFSKPLTKVGRLLGMNEVAAAGMIATLANNIPMFEMMKDMDENGKIINVAFCVSAAFVFGDHLGFTAGVASHMIPSMIVGKLVGGITAVMLAMFIISRNKKKGAAVSAKAS